MNGWIGTSGFSYKEWKGSFYPKKMADREMLPHYARQLRSVEINSTFYRMPRAEQLARWAESVPKDFRFAIKAPRRITHVKRLQDVDDSIAYLAQGVKELGGRCGVLLFQFPPFFQKNLEIVKNFLTECWAKQPNSWPLAFEFRHPSWEGDELLELLSQHRIALCVSDTDKAKGSPPQKTAPFAYLRLRREDYSASDLAKWAETLGSGGFEDVYVYFKHEVHGPAFAKQLAKLLTGAEGSA